MSNLQSLSSLTALFNPRSVAIVGASEDRNRLSGRPQRYLMEAGFKGAIYPVNPNRSIVQSLPAYASIAGLASTPDVALIIVPVVLALKASDRVIVMKSGVLIREALPEELNDNVKLMELY
jgi:acyl-CoA synthetase (NDP forming)